VEALDEFYEGVYAACEKFHVDLIGGDTCSSQKGFVISVTAIGEVTQDKFVTRSGAKKNDLVCVTGDLGGAYLGLQLLEREKKIYLESPGVQPDLEQKAYIVGRILKPEPRAEIVEWLKEHNIVPTSMIDVSDGLSSELLHICKQSKVGCVIHEEKIPIHDEARNMALEFGIDPTTCALSGGEDYELLFTLPQADYEKLVGEVNLNGRNYSYVKRKVSQDTLYLLCLPNNHKDRIQSSETGYGSVANDFDSNSSEKASKKVPAYNQFHQSPAEYLFDSLSVATAEYSNFINLLSAQFTPTGNGRPPQIVS
ncbi:MAG: thiamine-phosphate kinase, partial [Sphingobacteriales bacterium]